MGGESSSIVDNCKSAMILKNMPTSTTIEPYLIHLGYLALAKSDNNNLITFLTTKLFDKITF